MTTLVFLWQNNPTLVWEGVGSKETGRLDTWALPASSGHLPTRVLPGPRLPLCEQVGWGSASPPFARESAVVHGKECLTFTPIPRQPQDLLWLYVSLHFLEFYISGTLQDALFFCLAFCFQYNYLEIYPCCVSIIHSFSSQGSTPLYGLATICSSIHLQMVRYFGCFWFRPITNNVAKNICVQNKECLIVRRKDVAVSPACYLTSLSLCVFSHQKGTTHPPPQLWKLSGIKHEKVFL